MNKPKLVPAYNCEFHLTKGRLKIFGNESFTVSDFIRTFSLADYHAQRKKIKKPDSYRLIPTLAVA
jgi:hypothetical protein